MQIDALRYFVELARMGSFYSAAKRVFISQQGLNKAISSLEAELGVQLVKRESRGVRLTAAGKVFLEHAEVLIAEHSDMLKDLYAQHAISGNDDARLVVHMSYYPSQISEPFVRQMKSSASINLVEEPFLQIVEGARESDGSELFLAHLYRADDFAEEFPDLVFEPVIMTRAGVIWRDDMPLGAHGSIHREQLADVPLTVDSHREMRHLLEYVMEDYPLNDIRLGVANPKGRIEYLVNTGDVAALFDSFGFTLIQANPQLANERLHFTPFSTPRSITYVGFFYHKKARPNMRARHVIEVLHRYIQQNFADYLAVYKM